MGLIVLKHYLHAVGQEVLTNALALRGFEMARQYSRSIQQVYALEGWRGAAKLFPELEGRTDSAKRSFVYRVAKGYPSTGKQVAISAEGKTNVQRRAGRLLARKEVTDSKGKPVLDNDGEVMKTAISPTNNVKLAIKSINSSRASERRLTRQATKSGRIPLSVSEYNLQKNATLTTAEKNALYRNLGLEKKRGKWQVMRDEQGNPIDTNWDAFRESYGASTGAM